MVVASDGFSGRYTLRAASYALVLGPKTIAPPTPARSPPRNSTTATTPKNERERIGVANQI
jgi:hypothetical protein